MNNNIQSASQIPFLTPAAWNPDLKKSYDSAFERPSLRRAANMFTKLAASILFTTSDFYLSNSTRQPFVINFYTRKALLMTENEWRGDEARSFLKFIHYLRLFTGSCLAINGAKALSHSAVKIWKEQAPKFVHLIQKIPTTPITRTIQTVVLTGVATAVFLVAVKIVLRCSLNFQVKQSETNQKKSNTSADTSNTGISHANTSTYGRPNVDEID